MPVISPRVVLSVLEPVASPDPHSPFNSPPPGQALGTAVGSVVADTKKKNPETGTPSPLVGLLHENWIIHNEKILLLLSIF